MTFEQTVEELIDLLDKSKSRAAKKDLLLNIVIEMYNKGKESRTTTFNVQNVKQVPVNKGYKKKLH